MDRDGIERHDFPVGRRGYDREAVDAHLRRVADEFEALRDRAHRLPAPQPLSAGTSEQVRVILEAAERSATELRAQAGEEAGARIARVGETAQGLTARVEELERELGGLLEALRRGSERLSSGLAELQERVRAESAESAGAGSPSSSPGGELAASSDPAELLPDPSPNGDDAGARLIALNMALSGAPREETARYLAEHFALADPEALLDDVYARADQ